MSEQPKQPGAARQWHIYVLIDPRDGAVRYVGWSFNVLRRASDHVLRARAETTHKANWLNLLASLGLSPAVKVVESGAGDGWKLAEPKWVKYFREAGCDLTNATDGGEGCVGFRPSERTRALLSAAKKGKKQTAEHIKKCADARRGKPLSQKNRDGISRANKGRPIKPHIRKLLSEKLKGRKPSPEALEKIRQHAASRRGVKHTPESIRKMSEAKKGRTLTDEHRRKLSAAKKGCTLTDEHKRKIRESSGGWQHSAEARARISAARRGKKPAAATIEALKEYWRRWRENNKQKAKEIH